MNRSVVLVVMDGVGETKEELGNMVLRANTPTLDATEIAVESVDLQLARIKKVCDEENCILM